MTIRRTALSLDDQLQEMLHEINGVRIQTFGDGDVKAERIKAGTIGAEAIQMASGGVFKSTNYVAGVAGAQIAGDGSAEFQDVTVRGDVITTDDTLATPVKETAGHPSGTRGEVYYNEYVGKEYLFNGAEWVELLTEPIKDLFIFGTDGEAAVGLVEGRFRVPYDATITGMAPTCGVAPTGTSLKWDVHRNGTTLFSDQDDRPELAVGDKDGLESVPALTDVLEGDILEVYIDQVGSGVAGSEPMLHIRVERKASNDAWIIAAAGAQVTGDIKKRLRVPVSITLIGVAITLDTAPVGADFIVDVHKDGTTVFTTQANRPTIDDGDNDSTVSVPDVTALVAGDILTFEVDQIGSGTAGSDLTIILRFARTTEDDFLLFAKPGALIVEGYTNRFRVPFDIEIQGIAICCDTAPVGSTLYVDVNYGDTSPVTIFTTQANRPQLATTVQDGAEKVPDVTDLDTGEIVTFDMDAVGSGTAGSDLFGIIRYQRRVS